MLKIDKPNKYKDALDVLMKSASTISLKDSIVGEIVLSTCSLLQNNAVKWNKDTARKIPPYAAQFLIDRRREHPLTKNSDLAKDPTQCKEKALSILKKHIPTLHKIFSGPKNVEKIKMELISMLSNVYEKVIDKKPKNE
jgi:hypothetical protein